jgi:hypothetical protein
VPCSTETIAFWKPSTLENVSWFQCAKFIQSGGRAGQYKHYIAVNQTTKKWWQNYWFVLTNEYFSEFFALWHIATSKFNGYPIDGSACLPGDIFQICWKLTAVRCNVLHEVMNQIMLSLYIRSYWYNMVLVTYSTYITWMLWIRSEICICFTAALFEVMSREQQQNSFLKYSFW